MPLLGSGVLAIWNNMTPSSEKEFVNWHVHEHIPERISVPGFLRGRRYIGQGSHPKYFNFYETDTVEVLASAAYRSRLDAPSPWTRKMLGEFKDTARTACSVVKSVGTGTGAWIETIQLKAGAGLPSNDFASALSKLLVEAGADPGIVGIHLLEGRHETSKVDTAEKSLRGEPDKLADWVILAEAVDADTLTSLRQTVLTTQALAACGADGEPVRGIYQFEFGLTKADLASSTAKVQPP